MVVVGGRMMGLYDRGLLLIYLMTNATSLEYNRLLPNNRKPRITETRYLTILLFLLFTFTSILVIIIILLSFDRKIQLWP